jgi:hypothetical protein
LSWIAEVGATLVGLGGLAFGWRQSTLSLGHQRTLADLAATRDLLERGAVHLHRVAYALDPVKQDLVGNAEKARTVLADLGVEYDEVSERLKVRLCPDHEATRTYVGAGEAFLEAWRAVDRVAVLHLPHVQGHGATQAMKLIDKDTVVLATARERFDEHRRDFIDAACRTAGARLPSR